MMVVREDKGTSFQEEGLWDQGLDVPSFIEMVPNKAKEKLMSLEEDHLVEETMRQFDENQNHITIGANSCCKLLGCHQVEVERVKEELTRKDEELGKEKDSFTNDAVNSYLVGFEDAVAQALGVYPESSAWPR